MVWPCFKGSGLAKTILQGTVKGKRKKRQTEEDVGRQYQRVDFASSTRAAENKTRWKRIVAKSSVVARRPSKVMG